MKRKVEDVEIDSGSEYSVEENEYQSDDSYNDKQENLIKKAKEKIRNEIKRRKLEDGETNIGQVLIDETYQEKGTHFRIVKNSFKVADEYSVRLYKHKHEVTCLVYSEDSKYIFTGSFMGSLVKWDAETGESIIKIKEKKYHNYRINCMAITDKYLATSDSKVIKILNIDDLSIFKEVKGHTQLVMGLAFQKGTSNLFSSDKKGSVLAWNIELSEPIEELIGHTKPVESIDCYIGNSFITCSGMFENTIIYWKMETQTSVSLTLSKKQLEFSLDCITMLNDRYLVAGSFDNFLYLWDSKTKKLPIDVRPSAHNMPTNPELITSNKISVVSVASLRQTNIFASGSNMSEVIIWKLVNDSRKGNLVIQSHQILNNIAGVINDMRFSLNGKELAIVQSLKHKSRNNEQRLYKIKSIVTTHEVNE